MMVPLDSAYMYMTSYLSPFSYYRQPNIFLLSLDSSCSYHAYQAKILSVGQGKAATINEVD